jgi:hypothetical protein
MRAGTVPRLANAWGHPDGTNMSEPGPPRITCVPEADCQLRQLSPVLACGSKASRSRQWLFLATQEKLHLRPDTPHLDCYDNPAAVGSAVTSVTDWFARHLGPGTRN